jgi:hypothetical protein
VIRLGSVELGLEIYSLRVSPGAWGSGDAQRRSTKKVVGLGLGNFCVERESKRWVYFLGFPLYI